MANTKKNGCTISHNDKTITLTKAYAKKANTPGTKEFRELAQLHKNYPDYDIVMRTATVSGNKEVHGGLSIEMIEKIIDRLPNSADLKREYGELIALYGREVNDKDNPGQKIVRVPYGRAKSWFLKRVPNYQSIDFTHPATADSKD